MKTVKVHCEDSEVPNGADRRWDLCDDISAKTSSHRESGLSMPGKKILLSCRYRLGHLAVYGCIHLGFRSVVRQDGLVIALLNPD